MLTYFKGVGGHLKFKSGLIDNVTFRLHYQYTFAVLLVACVLQTAQQYLGNPIDCDVSLGVPRDLFNTFCWIHGTFTLQPELTGKKGLDYAYHGVRPYRTADKNKEGDEIRHAWYQWVIFILLAQALACYFPHFLWKHWEGGLLKLLLQDFSAVSLDTDTESTKGKRHVIANYITRNLRTHNKYVYKFIFCEFLNLMNIVGQMYLMDVFFDGHFISYGSEILIMDAEKRVDPMAKVFPKMAKCTYYHYGKSGNIEPLDGLCILALNILNEKIYVFLWFWYIILISWTCIFFCFRIVTMVSTHSRYLVFCGRSKSSSHHDIMTIMENFGFGDWFIMMQLCKKMHPEVFYDLVIDLRNRLDPKHADNMDGNSNLTFTTEV